MTPLEIQLAMGIRGDEPLPYPKIENALRKAWRRGILERRTPQDTMQARIHSLRLTQEERMERVINLLNQEAEQKLLDIFQNPDLIPQSGLEKQYLFVLYKARMAWSENGDRSRIDNFPSHYEETDPEIAEKLARQVAIIRDLTPVHNGIDHRRVESAIIIQSEPDKG